MLRRTFVFLARPKGPLGEQPGKKYTLTMPYRTEVAMMQQESVPCFNTNIRELFKKPIIENNIKAIPRDLGEIPRNYVLKLLFLHQPIRLLDLWEVCKMNDDVPLDSSRHLRMVLRIAKLQKWVYAEKNQTDNLFYYYIHQSRTHEVQTMVRADEVQRKQREAEATASVDRVAEEKARHEEEHLDDTIVAMQNLLVSNVAQLQLYDPTYTESKPYVTETGAVNCAWHWHGSAPPRHEEEKEKTGAARG